MATTDELQEDREDVQRRRNIRRLGSTPAPGFGSTGVQPSAPPAEPASTAAPQVLRRLDGRAGPDVGGPPDVDAGTGSASIGDAGTIGKGAAKGAAIGGLIGGPLGALAGALIGGFDASRDLGLDPDLENQMAEQAMGGKPSGLGGGGAADAGAGESPGPSGRGDPSGQGTSDPSFRQGGLVSEASQPGFRQPTPATVHEGEFVVRPEAVNALGVGNLQSLNAAGSAGSTDVSAMAAAIQQQASQNLAPEELAELQSMVTPRMLELMSRAFGPEAAILMASINPSSSSVPTATPAQPSVSPGGQPVGASTALPPAPGALGVTNAAGPLSRGAAPFRPQNSQPATPLRRLGPPT